MSANSAKLLHPYGIQLFSSKTKDNKTTKAHPLTYYKGT